MNDRPILYANSPQQAEQFRRLYPGVEIVMSETTPKKKKTDNAVTKTDPKGQGEPTQ